MKIRLEDRLRGETAGTHTKKREENGCFDISDELIPTPATFVFLSHSTIVCSIRDALGLLHRPT